MYIFRLYRYIYRSVFKNRVPYNFVKLKEVRDWFDLKSLIMVVAIKYKHRSSHFFVLYIYIF